MTDQEQRGLLTLVLIAAAADGTNDPRERDEVTRVARSLSRDGGPDVAAMQQDVLLKRATLESAAAALVTPESRRLAYAWCVGVCDADGAQNEAERTFLSALRGVLTLDGEDAGAAHAVSAAAESLALAPLANVSSAEPPAVAGSMSDEERDRVILHYAILNGALELLPDSLASMAIIPLQMKMVYRIGQSFGFELDRTHVKDFLATAGVGLASQYVEQIGVKIVRGLLGRGLLGGLLGAAAGQSVSSGFSFATTYALGRLATRYYAGGRTISGDVLKDTYAGLLAEAKGLQGHYLPAMQDKARTINVAQLLADVRA